MTPLARGKMWLEPVTRWFRGLISEPREYMRRGILPTEKIPPRSRFMLATWLLFRALWDSDLATRAAATAYTFIFSLIPLLTTTLAFFTAFPGLQGQRETLQSALFGYLLPGAVRDVQEYLNQFSERAAAAGTVSSLVFFISILFLFESVEKTFNNIWGIQRARTWGARFQLLALFLIIGALVATVTVTITREAAVLTARVRAYGFTGSSDFWTQVGLQVGDLMTAWAFSIIANKVLPNTRVRFSAAIIGGIVAGSVWQALKSGFTWYIGHVASYENIYGAVGTVPVFFLWLYLSFLLLLIGAYISFVLQNLRALVNTRRFADRGQQQIAFHAVAVAATLARAYQDRQGPVTVANLAERLGIDPYFISQALIPLVRGKLVLCLDESAETPSYLLAAPGDSVTVGEIVRLASGEDLEVPEAREPSALHNHIADVFIKARGEEGSVLERLHLDELAGEI